MIHHARCAAPSRRLGLSGSLALLVLATLPTILPAQVIGSGDTSRGAAVQFFGLSASESAPVPLDASRVALLRRRITLAFEGISLERALAEIAHAGHLRFAYSGTDVPLANRVTLHAEDMTVAAVLTDVLIDAGVDVVVTSEDQFTLVRRGRAARPAVAPTTAAIVGFVTDSATNVPIEAAEVFIDTLHLRVLTNRLGRYRLAVPAGRYTVGARRIGYHSASQVIEVQDSATESADFVLVVAPTRMQDLVTTATGPQRRYELGNAITTIQADSIVATQPVHSVAELLESRVPGLTATHTSGAPGDPTRLRLRGLNSITRSNDPIVIVDGVRIYADQSDARANNLAVVDPITGKPIHGTNPNSGTTLTDQVPTRSPLDQIDVHSIATIEVFKGPSAATMYGADAANGVIVITTKRGKAGATRWEVGTDVGLTTQPGKYPLSYTRFGHDIATGYLTRCPLTAYGCVVDSTVRYQALNDPSLTPFGIGHSERLNVGVSGGASNISYAITGSYSQETGLLKLPDYEVRRYEALIGSPAPGWMRRPHGLSDWSATGNLSVELSPKATFSFTSTIDRSSQRRSTLEDQLAQLQGVYADTVNNRFWPGVTIGPYPGSSSDYRSTLTTGFRMRSTAVSTAFTEASTLNWRPLGWLSATANLGLNLIDRHDESRQPTLPPGDPYLDINSASIFDVTNGFYNVGSGSSAVTTVNLGTIADLPLGGTFRLRTAVGGNFSRTRSSDLIAQGTELIPGANGLDGARKIITTPQHSEISTFGWYVEPTLEHKRLFLSTGLRLDGGDTYGAHQALARFPKVSLSYLLSDEPFFPFKKLFSTLRLRAAYGQAGVQPGSGDRLRLYQVSPGFINGTVDQSDLTSLGNADLRPEKSSEFEGGFDADLLDDKLTFEFSAYNKIRLDALVPMPLPPSVNGGGSVLVNIGRVRNSGFEVSLGTNLLRSDFVTVGTQFHVSKNRNIVLSTGQVGTIEGPGGTRVVKGYPLFGRWGLPILHFADANHDGIITRSEVQLGDQEVFLGASEPDYEAGMFTNLSFARGLVTVNAGFSYTHGQLQVNETATANPYTLRGANDPKAPLGEQAAIVVRSETPYGLTQVLSTLRFNSLAVAFNFPERIAHAMGASTASVTVQGTNLGLWSNYHGKDPSVNAYSTGNVIADTGQLPLPRAWSFGFRFGF